MVALTKRTEYALIAMHHMIEHGAVAENGNPDGLTPVSAREIAERYGVPLPLLMNVLKKLAGEHVLMSVRGARGGYVLTRNPRQLSLAKLIEAVEGPVALVECACEREPAQDGEQRCRLSQTCPIKRPLQILHDRLTAFLKMTSVYDVCAYKDESPLTQVGVAVLTG